MKRVYIINGKFIATGRAENKVPHSLIYICQTCGIEYARLVVENRSWRPIAGCCENCESVQNIYVQIPGSIWHSYGNNFNYYLPAEVIKREFELTLNYYEEKIK